MSDKDDSTPRVYLARHGETEWAKSGRYTSHTEVDLTATGFAQVSSTAATLVGTGKLLDPSRLVHVFASPRLRATRTLRLLLPVALLPDSVGGPAVTLTEEITEWNYGEYEGLKTGEIRDLRKRQGLDVKRQWDIWRDGCPRGESSDQVTQRLDGLISRIREMQSPHMSGEKPADVLLVAHGLILRCFMKRWLGFSLDFPLPMMLAPGAIAVLSYKNNNVQEPAFHLGLALPYAGADS